MLYNIVLLYSIHKYTCVCIPQITTKSESGVPLLPSSNMEGLAAGCSYSGDFSVTSSLAEELAAAVEDGASRHETASLESLEGEETELVKVAESSKAELASGDNVDSASPSPLSSGKQDVREKASRKHPSLTVNTSAIPPPLSRTSSSETPSSPFLIPRNPFLATSGTMANFQWSSGHVRLLEDLLKSLQRIVSKWRG